jgi:hypothetical protein
MMYCKDCGEIWDNYPEEAIKRLFKCPCGGDIIMAFSKEKDEPKYDYKWVKNENGTLTLEKKPVKRKKVYRKSDGTYNWVEVEQPEKGEPYINDPVEHPSHYTSGSIEVWDFIIDQGLNYFEGNVIKYISRWKKKNGLEDLKKAKAYLDKMILWEEGKDGK